jgi:hypothetical protein
MHHDLKVPDLATLSGRIGQLVRSNELKMAGKLLATARTHLHQLAEQNPVYQPRYEQVAELRNELMEPGGEQFDEKRLLARMLEEEKELRKLLAHHPPDTLLLADTLVKSAAAIVLVYAEDMAGDAPLEMEL